MTNVTLVNHSSLLFNFGKNFILTDFWNTTPAFGSWLPSALPFYNPTYLAALSFEKNFYLAISHAHDDHLDDYFLSKYFNKEMKIIINKFQSPALVRRLNKLGFKKLITIDNKIKKIDNFEVISIFDDKITNDDACLVFRDKKYCIHHGNDNWPIINKLNLNKLKNFSKKRKILFASQTNSASGHPLTYPQFKNKKKALTQKVKKMVISGLENASSIEANYFLPYAGYSKAYVKGFNYEKETFDPTFENLVKLIPSRLKKKYNKTKILNLFCGGSINLKTGEIKSQFPFDSRKLIQITDSYVKNEGLVNKCDTYRIQNRSKINFIELKKYLINFNEFVIKYLDRFPNFYSQIIGKSLQIKVMSKSKVKFSASIKIGKNKSGKKILKTSKANKVFEVDEKLMSAVINKKIPFENLYTGYQSLVYRYPFEKYNRDITVYLIMFGYKYQNSK